MLDNSNTYRDPIECLPQAFQATHLASHLHGFMGWNAVMDGVCQVLQ